MLRRLYFQFANQTWRLHEQDITIQTFPEEIQGYEDLLPYIEQIFQPMFPYVEPETIAEQD